MPLVKRSIEPSAISRGAIGSDVRNELECVSNNTLSMIIKQLGSLSKQSEDLFAELYVETCTLANRTTNLGRRIDGLKQKICQLNPIVEEVSLQEINQRKPFKSVMCRDQQIMLRSTRPYSITEVYRMCEMPPALNKLDVFREDGMDSLKFYTNPEYFAELWFAEMKAAQHQQKKIKQKHSQLTTNQKQPKTVRTPKNKLDEFKELRHGPEFVERPKRQLQNIQQHEQQQQQIINNNNMNHIQKNHATPSNPAARKPSDKQKKPLILHPQPLSEMSSTPNDSPRYEPSEFNKGIKEINAINQFDHVQHEKMRMADCRSNSVSQIAASRPSVPPPAPPTSATLKKQSSISQTTINNNANNFNVVQQYQQMQQQTSVTSPSQQEYLNDVYPTQQPADFVPSTPTSASVIPSYKRSELPPPPSPPSQDQSFDFHKLPSPTAMPPPPAFLTSDQQHHQESDSSILPPPPPLPDSLLAKMLPFPNASSVDAAENKDESGSEINFQSLKIINSHLLQPDEESVNSSSTTTTETNVDGIVTASTDTHNDAEAKVGDKGPIVRDTRSDLLSAIREGIQLRKVEENRLKCEQKHTKKGGALDVQSIMEAAFEMRRKVMENADDDEDDEENNWSD